MFVHAMHTMMASSTKIVIPSKMTFHNPWKLDHSHPPSLPSPSSSLFILKVKVFSYTNLKFCTSQILIVVQINKQTHAHSDTHISCRCTCTCTDKTLPHVLHLYIVILYSPLRDLISLLARLILATLPIRKWRADRELILLWERSNTCKWGRSYSLKKKSSATSMHTGILKCTKEWTH